MARAYKGQARLRGGDVQRFRPSFDSVPNACFEGLLRQGYADG